MFGYFCFVCICFVVFCFLLGGYCVYFCLFLFVIVLGRGLVFACLRKFSTYIPLSFGSFGLSKGSSKGLDDQMFYVL